MKAIRVPLCLGATALIWVSCGIAIEAQSRVPNTYPKAVSLLSAPAAPSKEKLSFGSVPIGQLRLRSYPLKLKVGKPITSIDISDQTGAAPSSIFKYEYKLNNDCQAATDTKAATDTEVNCEFIVGFVPSTSGVITGKMVVTTADGLLHAVTLDGTGTAAQCAPPAGPLLPATALDHQVGGVPSQGEDKKLANKVAKDFDARETAVNCYYATDGPQSYFNQFQSIYNAASGSATVNANIASLNFNNGTQLTLGTNIQVGSGGTVPPASASGTVPILAPTAAGQAAQNMFYGGTVFAYDVLPFFDVQPSRFRFSDLVSVREGVDLQSFTGTNTVATNPNTHFNTLNEAYIQYDGIPPTVSGTSPGSIFVDILGGYCYTGHRYARDYGFGKKVNSATASVSMGIFITGVVKVVISRAFGPSQKYIDSTTMNQTVINNFKAYSFAISYQSKGTPSSNNSNQ